MKTQFTTGQFAALHGIHKKTLLWYDTVGIFKPAIVKENGYRYYTCQQSPLLETILTLRELGVSIPEIQSFLQQECPLSHLLDLQISRLDLQCIKLHRIRKALMQQKNTLENLSNLPLDAILQIEKPTEWLYFLPCQVSFESEAENIIRVVKSSGISRLESVQYGSVLPVHAVYDADWNGYQANFIRTNLAIGQQHQKLAGCYLQAYHVGSWESLPETYARILTYAKENALTLNGFSYETSLYPAATHLPSQDITQIEILIAHNTDDIQPKNPLHNASQFKKNTDCI